MAIPSVSIRVHPWLILIRPNQWLPAPRPERRRTPLATTHPPLLRELPPVLLEQSLRINPRSRKRPAAEMMNKEVVGDGQFKAGPPRPDGQIIVIEEPQPEPLVEPADRLINDPLHEQAEPGYLSRREPLPAMLLAPSPRKTIHLLQPLVRDILNQLRRRRIIGHRPDQTNPLLLIRKIRLIRGSFPFRG